MLRKGAIVVSDPKEDQFLSPWFLGKKRDGENHPAVNLKDLNSNIPYQLTKMELLFPLNKMLLPYFAIFLSVKSRKNLGFRWKGLVYKLCYLCFRISSATLVFTKLLKFPISLSLLRKLNTRIIIYLDDAITSSLEDLLMGRDILIFMLQHLGFLINIKKSSLQPRSPLEFFGVIKYSMEMTLSLSKEKALKVKNQCQEILGSEKVTVTETKQTDWEAIIHSNSSSSSTSPL